MFYRECKDRNPWNFTGIDGLTALQSLSALSAVRQLEVGVFIKSLSKACFVKELWIRTFTSPVTWIYWHLRGIVRFTSQQKLLESLLIKRY